MTIKQEKVSLFKLTKDLSSNPHTFLCLEPDNGDGWYDELAKVYVGLRGSTITPLNPIVFEGLTLLDVTGLRKVIEAATVPEMRGGNFDVVRSDFGEVWSYVVLENHFMTRFGYKQIRDRETIQLPGRGIDGIGIEYVQNKLKLVLLETKVSDETVSPPQVVDKAVDSLRAQHQAHLKNRNQTFRKIVDAGRRAWDQEIRDLLFASALFFEAESWEKMELVCCCFLVRSQNVHQLSDFGSFQASPADYVPANVRFLVMCIPKPIEEAVNTWYSKAKGQFGAR